MKVPFVQQREFSDCAAACVAMVLAYHGGSQPLERVRGFVNAGRDGADAQAIIEGAERLGLRGRGVRVEVEALKELPRATILHWEFNHFVVLEDVGTKYVTVIDPAFGRRVLPWSRIRRSFTGVALLFEPREPLPLFTDKRRPLARYARAVLQQRVLLVRSFAVSVLLRIIALGAPLLTGFLVDRVAPLRETGLFPILAVAVIFAVIFHVLSTVARSYDLLRLRTRLDLRLSVGFLEHMMHLPYKFFESRSAGDLMMRVASNATIREQLTTAVLSTLLDGPLVVIYLVLVAYISPVLALVMLALSLVQLVVLYVSKQRVHELMSGDLESQARAQAFLARTLLGV
ncbi:MAG: cysteine peptidase family C39 domain-containing protein, partial [Kofleriaceae bacterium]